MYGVCIRVLCTGGKRKRKRQRQRKRGWEREERKENSSGTKFKQNDIIRNKPPPPPQNDDFGQRRSFDIYIHIHIYIYSPGKSVRRFFVFVSSFQDDLLFIFITENSLVAG